MLVAVHVSEGQPVNPGDILFTLETTKSTAEVTADAAGFLCAQRIIPGTPVRAGDIFAYLAPEPDWQPAPLETAAHPTATIEAVPDGLRITQPALTLARDHGLDLSQLPVGPLITEKTIRETLTRCADGQGATPPDAIKQVTDIGGHRPPFDPTALVIYGGGGHSKALIDLIRALGSYRIAGILDDHRLPGEMVMGIPILGGPAILASLYDQGIRLAINAVGGIGNIQIRINVFEILAANGFACPALIHPRAVVEPSAEISPGVQVFPLAYVGSQARLGFGAIVNTGAIVSHDCTIADYTNISPGAMLAGNVETAEGTLIGMGVTVNLDVKIGQRARIGNSATI